MSDDERFRNAVIYGTSHPEMYMSPIEEIERLRAENEKLQRKLHDATVKYQRLLMQYEPEKAAGLADATFKGDDNVG